MPQNFFHQDVTLLPAAAPDEWCFALPMFFSHVGPRESLFRVRLPADPTSAVSPGILLCKLDGSHHTIYRPHTHRKQGITKELTSGRWAIEPKVTKRTRTIILAASTYSDLDLPPVLAPAILAARTAAAKQPFASADIIASALQPHIIDSVVRFAISSGRDIA